MGVCKPGILRGGIRRCLEPDSDGGCDQNKAVQPGGMCAAGPEDELLETLRLLRARGPSGEQDTESREGSCPSSFATNSPCDFRQVAPDPALWASIPRLRQERGEWGGVRGPAFSDAGSFQIPAQARSPAG